MATQVPQPEQEEIERDLDKFERGIRELKIQYDRFFAGALKREPIQLKFALKKIIKRYNETPMRGYGHRFRFNSLVSRYNILSEMLLKGVQRHEGGDARYNRQQEVDLGLVAKCRVQDPRSQSDALREIYREFVQQRIRQGIPSPKVPFDKFVRGIESQTARLRAKSDCDDVEVRLVVKDHKVQLSARPVKDGSRGGAKRKKAGTDKPTMPPKEPVR